MVEKIMELCRAMGSGEEQDVLLLPLVEAAVVRLSARLKADVTPEDCGSAFLLAAAVEAMEDVYKRQVLMPRSFVEQAAARCSVEGSRLWFSCNPESPAHWF